jgi:hypothetical protein
MLGVPRIRAASFLGGNKKENVVALVGPWEFWHQASG